MQNIIAPIQRNILLEELNATTFLRHTNKGNNEIYIVNVHNAPNTIREIGRLREIAFREGGGGTGHALDLDDYDTGENCYQQLIVWNPADQEIIGGYRFIKGADAVEKNGRLFLSTTEYFNFSCKFSTEYFPKTIELGRSFIQPNYQNKEGNRKGLFSLDNLWDGLGALIVLHKDVNYFYGKVTMYKTFNPIARDLILCFMHHYFPDNEKLVTAKPELYRGIQTDVSVFEKSLTGLEYKEGHALLHHAVKEMGEQIPPLLNSYMNTSPSMKTFETAFNPHFGDVEETGILIDMREIYPTKKDRHINSFINF